MISTISVVPLDALEGVCASNFDVTTLLKAAGGLLAENPQLLSLRSSSSSPRLVLHNTCNKGVQLLGLQAVSTPAAPTARSVLYTAGILQHAALLLLLLVSDSAVFVLPAEAVSPALLQLLHLLATVYHALIRQQDVSQQADRSALAQLLAGRQQPVQLHIALQATMQQHDSGAEPDDAWPAAAAAAVQRAEQTLLKCTAAELSPTLLQQQQQGGRVRTAASSSRKGRLFELASVHCCCRDGGPNTAPARHRAVLGAVQQQLLAFDRHRLGVALQPSSSISKQQQQSQKAPGAAASTPPAAAAASLPGLDQLLGHIIASTTAAAVTAAGGGGVDAAAGVPPQAATGRAPVTQQQLSVLWQDLLQALFPGPLSVERQQPAVLQPGRQSGLPASQQQQQQQGGYGYLTLPLHDVNLTVDEATQADEDSSVSEDSWDDEEQGWEEVQQQEDEEVQQQQRQQQQQQRDSRHQQAPGRLLAAAVDPLYVVSAQNCRRAAVAALRAYLQVLPQRCTAAVRTAAVQHAVQQYTSAAAGPAALELQEQLVACCLQVWQKGRQQCSQLSLTGRPCVLSPHDAAQQPHSSSTQLQVCAPDGSSMLTVPDWFDVTAANVTPAQQLLAQQESAAAQGGKQQQQQQSQRKKQAQQQQAQDAEQGRLLPVLAHRLLHRPPPAGAGADGSSMNSSSSSRLVLGPWMNSWQLGCGASAYDTQAGLSGPGWVPGFNKLQPLAVLAPPAAAPPSSAAAAPAAAGQGPPVQQAGQQQQPRRQPHGNKQEQTFASQLKRKGGRGAGAASAPPPEPVLGPEDFPTLQQAAGSKSKKHVPRAAAAAAAASATATAAPQQQQQQPAAAAADGSGPSQGAGQQAGADDAAAAAAQTAQKQQDLLVAAWAQLAAAGSQGPTAAASGSGTTAAAAAAAGGESAELAADLTGSRQQPGGRGVPKGGGRAGGRWQPTAAAAAGAGAGPGRGRPPGGVREAGQSVPEAAAAVLASLWIGIEYESLSGSRILLQPQQLPALMPQLPSLSRQQPTDPSFAAATAGAAGAAAAAAAAAMRDNPTDPRHRRGGRQQQQQQQQGRPGAPGSLPQQSQQRSAQTGTSPVTGISTGFGGLQGPAVQLLLGDIPLFLCADLLQLPKTPTAAAAAAGAAAGAVSGAGPGLEGPSGSSSSSDAGLPLSLSMLQLQRIYVRTPAGPFSFAAQPRVCFTRQMTSVKQDNTPASTAGAAGVAAADASDGSGGGSSNTGVVFECAEQQVLPADSLTVLNLPKVYAAPTEWVQAVNPSAAALAATTVKDAAVTAAGSSAATVSDEAGAPAASEAAAAVAVGAGSSSGGSSPAGDPRDVPECSQGLVPLIPVQVGLRQGPAGSGSAAEVAGWSAVLCAGSWLYPVGCGSTSAVGSGEGAVK